MPTTTGRLGESFTAVLTGIRSRLAAALSVNAGFIKVVCVPDNALTEYLSQDGILLRIRSPRPFPKFGAGRQAPLTSRIVDAIIVTQNLQDPGGDDTIAVNAHITREESVINALHLFPPSSTTYSTATGIMGEWVEGGEEIVRKLNIDPGLLVSVHSFAFTYCPPTVTRA